MVYNLLSQLKSKQISNYEIIIVTPDTKLIANMKETLSITCSSVTNSYHLDKLIYVNSFLSHYIDKIKKKISTTTTTSSIVKVVNDMKNLHYKFDFIEYNGGLSMNPNSNVRHLIGLNDLLHENGVIGITYFTKNKHVDNIKKLLLSQNNTYFLPFSLERNRFIQQYLIDNNMNSFINDHELIASLGGERHAYERNYIPHKVMDLEQTVEWKTFTQIEVTAMIESAGNEYSIYTYIYSYYIYYYLI